MTTRRRQAANAFSSWSMQLCMLVLVFAVFIALNIIYTTTASQRDATGQQAQGLARQVAAACAKGGQASKELGVACPQATQIATQPVVSSAGTPASVVTLPVRVTSTATTTVTTKTPGPTKTATSTAPGSTVTVTAPPLPAQTVTQTETQTQTQTQTQTATETQTEPGATTTEPGPTATTTEPGPTVTTTEPGPTTTTTTTCLPLVC